jgi:type IV pilus assembly protein PilA
MRKQTGFTLIELMIVVAIVAILAAIAMPAYQSYVNRAKATELSAALSGSKTAIEVCASAGQTTCTLPAFSATQYVAGVSGSYTTSAATLTATGTGTIGTCTLASTSITNGQVVWGSVSGACAN